MSDKDFQFAIDPKEWAALVAMMEDLPVKVGQNAFAKSVKSGTEMILAAMRSNIDARAKDPTGMLANSLSVKRKKKYEPMFWHSSVAVYVGKKRDEGAYYWNMVEHGHRIVTAKGTDTGKRTRAMEFAIMAVESTKSSVLGDFASRARAEINKAWKKHPKA